MDDDATVEGMTYEQAYATLGAVDACVLLSFKESEADVLIRRVIDRGREPADEAALRVRSSISDTARAWAVVGSLAEQLRGVVAEVNAVQSREEVVRQVEEALKRFW